MPPQGNSGYSQGSQEIRSDNGNDCDANHPTTTPNDLDELKKDVLNGNVISEAKEVPNGKAGAEGPKADAPAEAAKGPSDEEREATLHKTGLIASLATIGCFFYGKFVVGDSLPTDDRQDDWLLMYSPVPTLVASLLFVYSVTCLGPRLMRGRTPFTTELKGLMMFYNAFQVGFSAWITYQFAAGGWLSGYSWRCQLCDYSNNPQALVMLSGCYWYYFSKFVDFLDTIFFVLHKKYEHISLLHVIHHSVMPVSMYFGVRFIPGGHATLLAFLNSFVHVVMYFYYLVSAMGPQFRKFLWWKKYLTKMQLVQFATVMIHSGQLAFSDCPVPNAVIRWVGGMAAMFFGLFSDFYIKAYLKRRSQSAKKSQKKHISFDLKDIIPCHNDVIKATGEESTLPVSPKGRHMMQDLRKRNPIDSIVGGVEWRVQAGL
ncbi:unnamed protein product [Meganyctiphanes norvegica]|uniref:Elongation of very long chain fatty acids protein n=1 Tax=Meganyctiphanes norvegica TaxID=48144 RepID=A0AAV2QXB7_MEGNR